MDQEPPRFVFVPVPRAHVLDVMRWLVFRDTQRAEPGEWDAAALASFLESLPDSSRAIVSTISANPALTVRDLATAVADEIPTVATTVQDINRRARDAGLAELIDVQRETALDADGNEQKSMRLALAAGVTPLLPDSEPTAATDPTGSTGPTAD
jgi:hypothetical protein